MITTLEDLYPREIANRIKIDAQWFEERGMGGMIGLIEKGYVKVSESKDGKLAYSCGDSVNVGKLQIVVDDHEINYGDKWA